MSRPVHLPIRGAAPIVKASRLLTSGQKLVWLELLELDQGGEDGAWASATVVAARLGRGTEAVEEVRRELKAAGLLVSRQPPGRRTASWYPTLPAVCGDVKRTRPSVDEVNHMAPVLDAHLVAALKPSGVSQYASSPCEVAYHSTPDDTATGVPQYAGPSPGVAYHSTPDEGSVAPATSSRERGERGESVVPPVSPASPEVHEAVVVPPASQDGETGEVGGTNGTRDAKALRQESDDEKWERLAATVRARRAGAQPIAEIMPAVVRRVPAPSPAVPAA